MENIIERNTSQQFRDDYQRYGIYVLFRRVMPDYRDGFKPVQRRILWAMLNDSKAVSRTVKSATVVGDAMGKYHPHGDSGVYGTIKPMTNWFECYLPLIQGQGNFGNFLGDGASASRYTECKLSKFALDCVLKDLMASKETVDWSPNYDETLQEPDFLPATIPLLLINGCFGIGLGKKTEIPTHNTNEVIDACLTLIRNPNAEITLVPDHCMKCEIENANFKEISRTGFGYYTVRGIINTEVLSKGHYRGKVALVIKSVPNLTYLEPIIESIEKMVMDKRLIQIDAMHDESEGDEMRYVIVLKNGADPNYVKDMIYRNTNLEHSDRINFEVLNGLQPLRMSYKSYLLSFIDHRKVTKFRLYSNKLQAVQTKIHQKEAYIKLLESGEIDYVIDYIKKMKKVDTSGLIEYLIKRLKITDLQAQFIIDSNLSKLSYGYLQQYKEEAKVLKEEHAVLMNLILNPDAIVDEIVKELEYAKAAYGHSRNCKIVKSIVADEVPHGLMSVIVTEKNRIKKIPKGAPIGSPKGDPVHTVIEVDNAEKILIFDNAGKVFSLPIDKIPLGDRGSAGTDIRFLIKGLMADINCIIPEKVIKAYGDKDATISNYLVCLTKSGLIKKMDLIDFVNIPTSGLIYVKLDKDDFVNSICIAADTDIIVVFNGRRAMTLPVGSNISHMKRNAKGNKTFREGDIDGMNVVDSASERNSLVVITQNGKFNKIPLVSLIDVGKPKRSFPVIKLSKGDSIQNILIVDESDIIRIRTQNGETDVSVMDLHYGSSISTGDKVLPAKNDTIIYSYRLFNPTRDTTIQ